MKMKKIGFAICFLASILLIVGSASAVGEIKLSLSNNDITTYIGDITSIDVTITNNQLKSDTFSINVFPSYWYGILVNLQDRFVSINARSSVTTKIYFDTRSSDALISPFTITVQSISNKNINDTSIFKLTVLRKSPVFVSDIRVSKYDVNPEDTITIDSYISNTALVPMGPYNIQTNLKSNEVILKRFDDRIESMPPGSVKKLTNTYTFDKYVGPGNYFVEVLVSDGSGLLKSYKISDLITVNKSEKLVKEKSVEYGIMSQTVTIKVTNEGNIVASNFYITESVPQFVKNLFYPQVEPDKVEQKDIRVIYYWHVDSLAPGQEITVKYEIRSISIIVVFVLLLLFVLIAFKYVFSPKVVKRVRHSGALTREKEVVVSIEVRNGSRHEIKDLIVRDFVPTIATVVEGFDTIKPSLRKTPGGTELLWRIDSLKPFEERVLSYRIKPVVEVAGTLKLPKARIAYFNKKKEKKVIASKSVWIKAR
jgi:hypothetical protein